MSPCLGTNILGLFQPQSRRWMSSSHSFSYQCLYMVLEAVISLHLFDVTETLGTLEWRAELTVESGGKFDLCHKHYSLANAGYTIFMTLWWSTFLQDVSCTHFGIDCLLSIQVQAPKEKYSLVSVCTPWQAYKWVAWRMLHRWGDTCSTSLHRGSSVAMVTTVSPQMLPDACSIILTNTSLDRHII